VTINNFIPAVWAGSILKNLNDAHVWANAVNRDYEGNISGSGSSVKISGIGHVTVRSYTRNSDISGPDELEDASQVLLIDQGDYFNFAIDDVDNRQANVKLMGAATAEAAWSMADVSDRFLKTTIYAGIPSTQTLTTVTGLTTTPGNAYDLLVDLDTQLNITNTPPGDRWAIMPYELQGVLRKDERFVSFGTPENRGLLVRGQPIGMAAGLNIYCSNIFPTDGSSHNVVVAGYRGAVTFAEQMDKTEAYRPQKRFSDALKGLHIYGAKVTRPTNLVACAYTLA